MKIITTFRVLALLAAVSAVSLQGQVSVPSSPPGESSPPPPPPDAIIRPAEELDLLAGPIALYPDPLIAELLPAATQPGEVGAAAQYLRSGYDPQQVDSQAWSPSVKAVAHYPDLIKWMADNVAWTTQLGQAFLYQPADLMNAIQRLRAKAQSLGNLVSTPQQQVVAANQIIEIVPANPEVIYVPVYQPQVVYYRPPPPGRFWISFGIGWHVGLWFNHDCDWRNREVIVWHPEHPRPRDWWYRPPGERYRPTVINNVTVVNHRVEQNVTVWHPRPGVERHEVIREGRPGPGGPTIINHTTVIQRPVVPSRPPVTATRNSPGRVDYPHRGDPARPAGREQHNDRHEPDHR